MGSPKGRKLGDWKTPKGWLLRDIIHILWNSTTDHSDENMGDMFFPLVPIEVCDPIVMHRHPGTHVTGHKVKDRGDKGTRSGYESEHPDKHALGVKMMPFAKQIVQAGRAITKDELDQIVAKAMASEEAVHIEDVKIVDKKEGVWYCNSTDRENCNFGITTRDTADKRISEFAKGDIDQRMRPLYQVWVTDIVKADRVIKKHFKGDHLGNERYGVPAETVWFYFKKLMAQHSIAILPIMVDGLKIQKAAE
jgi:hypothetical protein